MLTLKEGGLVERVIDLAFCDDTPDFAGWTFVDFKADREFQETSRYTRSCTSIHKRSARRRTRLHAVSCWSSEQAECAFRSRHNASRSKNRLV